MNGLRAGRAAVVLVLKKKNAPKTPTRSTDSSNMCRTRALQIITQTTEPSHLFVCTGHTPTLWTARFEQPSTLHWPPPPPPPPSSQSPSPSPSPPPSPPSTPNVGIWLSALLELRNAASFEAPPRPPFVCEADWSLSFRNGKIQTAFYKQTARS